VGEFAELFRAEPTFVHRLLPAGGVVPRQRQGRAQALRRGDVVTDQVASWREASDTGADLGGTTSL
jgi:hypothetical protein